MSRRAPIKITRLQKYLDDHGIKHYWVARKASIDGSKFSMISTGRMNPYPEEKEKIAAALGVLVGEIFEE